MSESASRRVSESASRRVSESASRRDDQSPITTHHSPLTTHLRRWGLRLRVAESFTAGPWGGAVGLCLGLALAIAARVWPLLPPRPLTGLAGFLTLAGVTIGVVFTWVWPRSFFDLARIFDRRFGLAERMTTAVEIAAGRLRTTPPLVAAQSADALAAAQRVDARALLPIRAPRPHLIACAALATILALVIWLPNPQEKAILQREAVKAAIEEEIAALEAARQEIAEAEGLSESEREAILQALDEAIAELEQSRARAQAEEALAALSEAERALAQVQDPSAETVRQGLERAAAEMSDSDLTRGIAEALARGDYETAAQALASFAGNKGEALTRAEELELARELAEAAKSLAGSNPELSAQLSQAAEAIERGDIAEAREAIRAAAQQMGAAGAQVEGQEALEGALSQLQEGREQVAQAGGGQMAGGQQQGGQAGEQAGGQQQGGQAGGQTGGQQQGGPQTQAGHSEDTGTGAPYDELYVPYRLGEQGTGVELGRAGEEGEVTGENPLPAPGSGASGVPYREVYAEYAAQAGAALEGSYIPLGLKQYVRDYFSSLEP